MSIVGENNIRWSTDQRDFLRHEYKAARQQLQIATIREEKTC